MKILFIIFLFGSILAKNCNNIFPNNFILEEQACGNFWHNTVEIKSNDKEIGRFKSLCPSWNQDINLFDNDDNKLGYTDVQTAFEWGTQIDLYDCNDEIFATIEEGNLDVIINKNKYNTKYKIFDKNNNLIGFSKKEEIFDSEFILRNLNDQVVAKSKKSFVDKIGSSICIDPEWTVNIIQPNTTVGDPRIISFITGLKAVSDMSDTDVCTGFVIFGITIASLIGLIILILGILLVIHLFFGRA